MYRMDAELYIFRVYFLPGAAVQPFAFPAVSGNRGSGKVAWPVRVDAWRGGAAAGAGRCRSGRSFQIPQPFTDLSAYENLLVAARFGAGLGHAEAQRFCVDILDRTGLTAVAERRAGGLSLLQRKRLELARAMATAPRLILLDEIAGGLTDAECGDLVRTIRDIHAGGTTIIWIEHVLHALNAVVERLMVLNFGKLLMIGAPDEVMASPQVREIYLGIEL